MSGPDDEYARAAELRKALNPATSGRVFAALASLVGVLLVAITLLQGPKAVVDLHELACARDWSAGWIPNCEIYAKPPPPITGPHVREPSVLPEVSIENRFIMTPSYFGRDLALSI